jgi:hypothetical protein
MVVSNAAHGSCFERLRAPANAHWQSDKLASEGDVGAHGWADRRGLCRWWPGQAGVTALTFNSAGAALAVGLRDGTVRVVDLRSHALLGGFKTYFGAVLCVAWSQDDRCVVHIRCWRSTPAYGLGSVQLTLSVGSELFSSNIETIESKTNQVSCHQSSTAVVVLPTVMGTEARNRLVCADTSWRQARTTCCASTAGPSERWWRGGKAIARGCPLWRSIASGNAPPPVG